MSIFSYCDNAEIWWDKSSKRRILWCKRIANIWDVDINNIAISKLVERKNNFKYLIGYLYKVIRPLVLILPKIK